MTHTPLPWTTTPGLFFVCQVGGNSDDPGIWSEALPKDGSNFPFGSKEADAAFIVRAVNSHEELVAALEACRDTLGIRDDFVPLGPAIELAPVIRAALAKAKGG